MAMKTFIPSIDQLTKIGFKKGSRYDGIDDSGFIKMRPVYAIRFSDGLITYDMIGRHWFMTVDAIHPRETKIMLDINNPQTLYSVLQVLKVEFKLIII